MNSIETSAALTLFFALAAGCSAVPGDPVPSGRSGNPRESADRPEPPTAAPASAGKTADGRVSPVVPASGGTTAAAGADATDASATDPTGPGPAATGPAATGPDATGSDATGSVATGSVATGSDAGQAPGADRSGFESADFDVLRSPAFKRRFIENYLPQTDIEPSTGEEERETLAKALDLIRREPPKLGAAATLLESARTQDDSRASVEFMLGHVRYQQQDWSGAAAAYAKAVEKHPKFLRAWQGLGQARYQQQAFDRLVPALTRVIELRGANSITYGLLGVSYAKLDQHLSAESAFRMAALLDPEERNWKMGLAEAFFKQERFADVVALCSGLLKAEPDNAQIWMIQANAYVGLKQSKKAAENFEIVDRLGGSTVETLNLLGDIYVNRKLFSLAADAYIRGLEKEKSGSPKRGIRAAKILAARGGLNETKVVADKVESMYGAKLTDDDRKAILRLRARVALAEGGTEEHVAILEQIVKLDPLDGEALILIGRHHGRNGRPEQAVFYFERAANIEEFEGRAKLAHAEMLVLSKKYREALPLLRRSQELQPRDSVQQFLEKVERAAQNR